MNARMPREEMPVSNPVGPDPSTLDGSRHLSRDCPECSGSGWAGRRQRLSSGAVVRVSLACRCPHGAILGRLYADSRDFALRRVLWLQEFPELWDPEIDHHSFDPVPAPRSRPRPGGLMCPDRVPDFYPDAEYHDSVPWEARP